jgi:hypothetical protein
VRRLPAGAGAFEQLRAVDLTNCGPSRWRGSSSCIDGTMNPRGNWWYSVASDHFYSPLDNPGPNNTVVDATQLFYESDVLSVSLIDTLGPVVRLHCPSPAVSGAFTVTFEFDEEFRRAPSR